MDKFIPYGRQWIDQEDINSVIDVLKSESLTQGPKVQEFEYEICSYTGAKYCVAVANGTAALHMAVAALDIEPGFEGITSPITFVASANCMVYNRIKPKFSDINPYSYNIDPLQIQKQVNGNTKLIIPVHFAGQTCDMEKISLIAKKHNLRIIEDAAHAIGSKYADGSYVGNCKHSDMTVFSFHPVKTLTTGEGGAITTNDIELYNKLLLFRSHGITKNPELMSTNPGPWYYEMINIGFNYRITDIQSALGLSQLKKLDYFVKRRREIVSMYNNALNGIEWLGIPIELPDVFSAFHLYVIQIDFKKLGKERSKVMNQLRARNIGTQVHYIPVHTQPFYREVFGYNWTDFPKSEAYYEKALSIPLFPSMSDSDVSRVIDEIRGIAQ